MRNHSNQSRSLLKGILIGKTSALDITQPQARVRVVFLEPGQQPEEPKAGERSYLIDFSHNSLN